MHRHRFAFVVVLVATLSLGLVACGDDSSAGDDKAGNDAGNTPQDVGQTTSDTGSSSGAADPGSADAGEGTDGSSGGSSGSSGGDGGGTDAATPDTGSDDCPGGFGCSCTGNSDCDSGACLDGPDGKVCTKNCTEACPTGYSCESVGSGDVVFLCVPRWVSLCSPCSKNDDCKTEAGGAICMTRGDTGSFCGAACKKDDDCPTGYACTDEFDKEKNKPVKQCTLKDKTAACACNGWAKAAGHTTACSVTNPIGTCKGTRFCDAKGLTACSSGVPSVEVCDGKDNDCDGTVDQLPAEATCAVSGKLSDGTTAVCIGKAVCKAGKDQCIDVTAPVDEKCDGVDNDCNGKTDDGTCDDNDACTKDVCAGTSGKCDNQAGAGCDDSNACTADSCDKKTGKCVFKKLGATTSCDDGNACTVGDFCGEKAGAAACLPGKATKVCDDANLCTDDACEPAKGCVNLANAVTQACYSGAKGTENVGTCRGGARKCVNGKLVLKCEGEVTPAKTEACDAKDDTCNGVVDEGCKVTDARVIFAAAAGQAAGNKHVLRTVVGGESAATSTAKGTKHIFEGGWLRWLSGIVGD